MLRQIESLLKERGPTCLSDIALHFETTPEAASGMLSTLESKGRVEKVVREKPCSDSNPQPCGDNQKSPWFRGCANCSLCSKGQAEYWQISKSG